MTVRVIFNFFRDFYGQNYAVPTVLESFPTVILSIMDSRKPIRVINFCIKSVNISYFLIEHTPCYATFERITYFVRCSLAGLD